MNRRLLALLATLAAGLGLAGWASLPPRPLPASAAPELFSAGRAMRDIADLSHAPHPTGSQEDAVVRARLAGRMRELGLEVSIQPVPLSDKTHARLKAWGTPAIVATEGANLVGLLPGADRTAPAVLLMAHHDTVAGSPGAADDSAGVAAILETARALGLSTARRRDLILLFTDAEETNSDGAEAFFARNPLAAHVGAVINLEARGGGGRALMFETGPDNGALVGLYGRAARSPSAQSLAVLAYRLLPNSSDFTLARARGLAGVNIAFLGRPGLYHAAQATPAAIDPGSVQHLGGQTLDLARALVEAPALPPRAPDAVFGDLLGRTLFTYPAAGGWAPIAAALVLFAVAGLRLRGRGGLELRAMLGGAAGAVWALTAGALLFWGLNRVSGAGPGANYYDRLAAIPRLELQAALAGLAVLAAVATAPSRAPAARFLGVAAVAAVLAVVVQALAPMAAPPFGWPLLLAAVAAAGASLIDPRLEAPAALGVIAVLGALAAAQTLYLGHFAFLGLGADLPAAAAPFGFLALFGLTPLAAGALGVRARRVATGLLILAALGCALSVRFDAPAQTIPAYARRA